MTHRSAGLLVLLFLLTLPAVTTRIYASDEVQYFAYLRSLWFDRDVSFDNEYRHFDARGVGGGSGFRETFLERTTETGKRINFATVGCAILWTPFYAGGDVVARLWGPTRGWAADGFSPPYIAAVSYGSAVYGFVALWLSALAARRWVGRGLAAAFLIWVGTPLLFYMYIAPPMSHACSAFAVAALVTVWLRVRERWSAGGLCALGATAALMAMVREQDAFFVLGPALDFARSFATRVRQPVAPGEPRPARLAAHAALGIFVAAVVYAPQALAYVSLNGYPGPSRLVARKMTWTAPHALEVLVSPAHGFFVWTPLAAIALAGLAWLAMTGARRPAHPSASARAQEARWVAVCLGVMTLAQVFVAGSVESWTVAGAFGQRRFVALTIVLVFGLAAALVWLDRVTRPARAAAREHRPPAAWRFAAAAVLAAAVWWNVGLMLQFGAGLMDRQRLSPARNAYVNFVELPRMAPELLRRYLFDRKSYYR